MHKEITYIDYTFLITVNLNSRIEKFYDGKKFSNIIVTNTSGINPYYFEAEVETKDLPTEISILENDILTFVNNSGVIPTDEAMLIALGFVA